MSGLNSLPVSRYRSLATTNFADMEQMLAGGVHSDEAEVQTKGLLVSNNY